MQSSKMIHRPANKEDFEIIYTMYMEPSANPYLTFDPMEREAFQPVYDLLLAEKNLYAVEEAGRVIATYKLIPKTWRQRHTLYLGSFAVLKAEQGKGFGKRILERIIADSFAGNCNRIELTVDLNNEGALSLYSKSGFAIEGILRKSYTRSDTDAYFDEYLMAIVK
jgi:putative acetyltransferase